MGRSHKPAELRTGRPSGPEWVALRKSLIRRWFAAGRRCYYCGHDFLAAELIEACHLISPDIAPSKGWSRDNLVPGHGSKPGRKCPEPSCQLACNQVASVAGDMERDENGADLPFTPQLIARKRAQLSEKNGRSNGKPAIPASSPLKSWEASVTVEHSGESVGRVW